jgi:hypothetical protein
MSNALANNKNWRNAIIALIAVSALAIGGTIYYGTVVVPAQTKAAELAACKTFDKGYVNAKVAFIDELVNKKHKPDPMTAVTNYEEALFKGSIQAAKNLAYEDKLGAAIIKMNISRLSIDNSTADAAKSGFQTVDAQAASIMGICTNLGYSTKAASSPSPSASK